MTVDVGRAARARDIDLLAAKRDWPKLSPSEAIIMAVLCQAGSRGVSRETLVDRLWGDDPDGGPAGTDKIISIHVSHLRAKGVGVETLWGIGYRLRRGA